MQVLFASAPCVSLQVPAPHGVHCEEPVVATNLPASQSVQPSAGLALYFPAGQALQMDAAADEVLPVGHVWHLLTSVDYLTLFSC